MRRVPSRLLFVAAISAAPWFSVPAQQTGDATLSASSGVYSNAQATRGRDLYAMQCRSCHTPESHTGAIFDSWWGGRLLSDLFEYVQERMPKNEPGSLTPQEYADVVAYLLRMNKLPSGAEELSTDVAVLRRIRIEKAK